MKAARVQEKLGEIVAEKLMIEQMGRWQGRSEFF